jgi:hypothetical protein
MGWVTVPRAATAGFLLGSHVVLLLGGYFAWVSVADEGEGDAKSGGEGRRETIAGPRVGLSPAEWMEEQLAEVREEQRRRGEWIEFETHADLEARMERDRESLDAAEEKLDQWLAGLRAKADEVAGSSDPGADIERRRAEGASDEDLLPHMLAWLRVDREAALAKLAGWHDAITCDGERVGAMLGSEFGEEWVHDAASSEATPYPVRLSLAIEAGRAAGMDGGVEKLLRSYERVTEPRLRGVMVQSFIGGWRLEDPVAVARFLGQTAPPELRDLMLVGWRSPGALGSAWRDWRAALLKELEVYPVPAYARRIAETCPLTEAPGFFDPKPPSDKPLEEYLDGSEGGDGSKLADAMNWKVQDWIEEGTDLRELYCEGRISRDELLQGLTERIPGSENYPDQLERAAWQHTVHFSNPVEAAAWGRELAARGDLSSPIDEGRRKLYYDPRKRRQLDRLTMMASLEPKKWAAGILVEDAVEEWSEWHRLSPPDARKWRESLPAGHPFGGVLGGTSGKNTDGGEGK